MKVTILLALIFATLAELSHATPKNTIYTNVGDEIRYLDPQKATAASSFYVTVNLFVGLYEFDEKNQTIIRSS